MKQRQAVVGCVGLSDLTVLMTWSWLFEARRFAAALVEKQDFSWAMNNTLRFVLDEASQRK